MRDAHQSGHAAATRRQHVRALQQLTDACSVGVLTEAVGVPVPAGWRRTPTETAVLWDDARWLRRDSGVARILTPPWTRGTSRRTSVDLGWGLLENRASGRTLLRVGGHHPAHLDDPDQKAANDAVLEELGITLRRLHDHTRPDVLTYSADWNLDVRHVDNAREIRHTARSSGLRMTLVVPPKPTIGLIRGRTIDAALTTAAAEQLPAMLDRVRGYDHRGFTFRG